MLKGRKTQIRPLEPEDLGVFYQWYNDPEVNLWASGAWPLNTLLSEEELERRFFDPNSDEHRYMLLNLQNEPIGTIGFREINVPAQSATLFIVIGEKDYWGQGYGTDALKTFLEFLFQQWNFHRISLDTWDCNQRARKAFEKLGFTLEGKLREARFVHGCYHDALMFGLLRSEFNKRVEFPGDPKYNQDN